MARGDVIFCHSNIGYFGRPENVTSLSGLCEMVFDIFLDSIGEEGTLVVPTFSYSFGSDKTDRRFDPQTTPSVCGAFSEFVRMRQGSRRSLDPMFSVAAFGRDAAQLIDADVKECFGEDSFWRRFLDARGRIVNLNFDAGSTFIHFVERRLEVPYRTDRTMRGEILQNSAWKPSEVIFNCRDLSDDGSSASFELFDMLARQAGIVRTASVGRGAVVSLTAADTAHFIESTLASRPLFLTVAGRHAQS